MTPGELALAGLAALAAGLVNALAGGGTLISFPMLLALGVPPVTANVTNTVALVPAALATARRRVVLKRPAHAPQLAGVRPPDLEVPGRAARYDVYVISPQRV